MLPATPPEDPLLGETLRQAVPEIIRLWEETVRQAVPPAGDVERPLLVNHLPAFLEQAADVLSSGENASALPELWTTAKIHASERADLRTYSLAQVLREFRLLSQAVRQVLEAERPLTPEARDTLDELFWRAGEAAATQFCESQQDRVSVSESRYRLLVENAPDYAMLTFDLEGRVTGWNEGAERILGWTEGEMLGRTADGIFTPEDRERGEPEKERCTARREGRAIDERWHLKRDGSRFWASGVMTLVRDDQGEPVGLAKVLRDVTEQKRVQEALQESEARYRLLLESSGEGIYGLDVEGRCTFVNPAAARMLGYEAAELIGQKMHDLIHQHPGEGQYSEAECPILGATRARRGVRLEDELFWRRDGSSFPVAYSSFPVVREGVVTGAVVTFTDVTERKRAERERERFFAVGADLLVISDYEGRFRWVSPAWERTLGWTAAELTSRPWIEFVHPEDRERTLAEAEGLRQGEGTLRFENRFRCADGTYRWLAWKTVCFPEEGRLYSGASDITERKRVEAAVIRRTERLHLLAQAAAALLSATDPHTMVRELFETVAPPLRADAYFHFMVNDAGDALRLDSCAGIPEDLATNITRLEFGQAVCGQVALQRQPHTVNHAQRSRDPRHELIQSFGIRAYCSTPLLVGERLIGTLSFASREREEFDPLDEEFIRTLADYLALAKERVRAEAEAAARAEELARANRHKDEFLAMLSHELRNPLAPILNAVQVLDQISSQEPQVARLRGIIGHQAAHMKRLIDDLLDVSRISRGKIQLQEERLNLLTVVAHAVDLSQALIDQKEHRLSVSLPPEPVRLCGDPNRLEQVLSNLLHNAAKYTEPGGEIRLSVTCEESHAVLRVADTGIGISPELLPRVFDLFTQAERGAARSEGGLGVGLTLVWNLVEAHGGTITAASPGLGRGSEFTVRLPLLAEGEPPRPERAPRASRSRRGAARVLIVDDNREAAETLEELLTLHGHEVATAYDGSSALAQVREFRPEVVLLDIGLPGKDGYQVAAELRGEPASESALIVALTGYGSAEDLRRSRAAGFNHHLVKPVDLAELQRLIDSR